MSNAKLPAISADDAGGIAHDLLMDAGMLTKIGGGMNSDMLVADVSAALVAISTPSPPWRAPPWS
jgi:hypothetical protein